MSGDPQHLPVLRRYAAGEIGTRAAIEEAGLDDYADLLIALAQNDIDFPRPASTPTRDANLVRARAILQPLLRHGL